LCEKGAQLSLLKTQQKKGRRRIRQKRDTTKVSKSIKKPQRELGSAKLSGRLESRRYNNNNRKSKRIRPTKRGRKPDDLMRVLGAIQFSDGAAQRFRRIEGMWGWGGSDDLEAKPSFNITADLTARRRYLVRRREIHSFDR